MKRIKGVLIGFITTILVLVLIFNIYNFICIKVLKQDLATINGYAVLEVVSGSMEPTIHVGDLIIIDTDDKDFNKKDIVTFYDVNGSFVTHRIIDINGNEVITQGDANDSEDEAINIKDIVGTYKFKVLGIGILIRSFKSPFVMIMILIIGLLICFLISTDKDGKAILTDDEKEFLEFKEYKKNKNSKVIDEKKEEVLKKENKTNSKKSTSNKGKVSSSNKKSKTTNKNGSKKSTSSRTNQSSKNSKNTKSTKKNTTGKTTTTKKSSKK